MDSSEENINNIRGHLNDRINNLKQTDSELNDIAKIIPEESDNQEISQNFSIIYHGLSRKFNLSPTESVLIAIIYALSQKEGACYIGLGSLATLLNVTEPTINTALQKLTKSGLIENGSIDKRYGTLRRRLTPKVINEIKNIKEFLKNKGETKKNIH